MAIRRKLTAALLALGVSLALSGPAIAQQKSADKGYSTRGDDVQGLVQGGADSGNGGNAPAAGADTGDTSNPAATTATTDSDTLPFTGVDIVLILGAGAMLLVLGLGVRRVLRAPDAA